MTPAEAERRIQQGYLDGQAVLKAVWRWRFRMLGAIVLEHARAAWRAVRP